MGSEFKLLVKAQAEIKKIFRYSFKFQNTLRGAF